MALGLPTLAREGLGTLALVAAVGAVALILFPWRLAVAPVALLIAFTAWFFRDPERQTPDEAGALVSPADGRIIRADRARVSVFMNVFDVHVCRAPCAGTVESVRHRSGRLMAAFKDAASEHNERTEIVLAGERASLRFTLVAGLVARRIVCRIEEGQALSAGERVGVIRFGSRVDLDLPAGTVPAVAVGERVRAGETVLARTSSRRRPA